MSTVRQFAGLIAAALLLLSGPFDPATAQNRQQALPENAVRWTIGDGWDCKSGFMKRGTACASITVPQNAYLTGASHGVGWEVVLGNHTHRRLPAEVLIRRQQSAASTFGSVTFAVLTGD